MPEVSGPRPSPAGRRSWLSRHAFAALALWMLGLGMAVGVAFPFVLLLLGIPRHMTLRPSFFVATIVAGLLLAWMNFRLASRVVGSRLQTLSGQMRRVGEVIADATYSGDWERCSPEACKLDVESDDAMGDAAASFNELITGLASSRAVQQAMSDHSRILSEHLELEKLTSTALTSFITSTGADAGGFCVVRDGALEMSAWHRFDPAELLDNATVHGALATADPVWIRVAADLRVDAGAVSFRPAMVGILPIWFRSVPVGLIVLAFARPPGPQTTRLAGTLRAATGVALNNALLHERFQRLAAVDPLTGAYNRRFGLARLQEEWARSVRSGLPLGLLGFDLDHFKAVNDTYGHPAGDRVLKDITGAARAALREGDVLIRSGGEEFLVVLPGGGLEDVRTIGERIRRAIGAVSVAACDASISVTVSIGAASTPNTPADSPEDLLALVDEALYASKDAGRNRLTVCSATPSGSRFPGAHPSLFPPPTSLVQEGGEETHVEHPGAEGRSRRAG